LYSYLVAFAQERIIRRVCLGTALALALLAGWALLCGCSTQRQPPPRPEDTPPPTQTAATILAAQPAPTETSLPSPPAAADLAIEIPDKVEIVAGETTVYTLTLRNHGPEVATSIVLTGMLPIGVTALWAEPAQAACWQIESGVDCDLGDLAAGGAATVTLDLSGAGAAPILTGAREDGTRQDLPWLTCAADQEATPPRVTCHLDSLRPGAETLVRVGLAAGDPLTGALVHTATVTALEQPRDVHPGARPGPPGGSTRRSCRS
jgi:uncharacterized repeat protein (TIGR01451 family)